jgi:rhodanese-related sulfurtransferase
VRWNYLEATKKYPRKQLSFTSLKGRCSFLRMRFDNEATTTVKGDVIQNRAMSINPESIEENLQDIKENVQQNLPQNVNEVGQKFDQAHDREEDAITKAKEAVVEKLPIPKTPSSVTPMRASVHELKTRLSWGEPGLTILDVRDRSAFEDCHIMGAMNVPMEMIPDAVQHTLQSKRDIYIYGEQAASAVQALRSVGFLHVTELEGGLDAWREISGSIDGVETQVEPSAGAYNVVSRLKEFAEERAKEKQMSK